MSEPRVYQVGELNRRIALALERWPDAWVEGEVSDARRNASGHVYFTLQDSAEASQIRCVMFASDARRARAELSPDARVRVRGRFDLYRPRGALQLIVRIALPAGEGDRREQRERLKKKLAAEGLFAVTRKRPIPRFPRIIGVVTSRDGDALHDVIRVSARRAPVRLVLSHCLVQGADAPRSIVTAIRRVAALPGLDAVILTRGGGASADLSAFDDEAVARAIAGCPVPVVSGVGHERDESIADLVADLRAATPSHAAELVVPERTALVSTIESQVRALSRAMQVKVGQDRLRLGRLDRKLRDPRHAVAGVRRTFDAARVRLASAGASRIGVAREALRALTERLARSDPRVRLAHRRGALRELSSRMRRTLPPRLAAARASLERTDARLLAAPGPVLQRARAALGTRVAQLEALSPLEVLSRGYAIALADGRAIVDATDVSVGDAVSVRLSRGALYTTVTAIDKEPR